MSDRIDEIAAKIEKKKPGRPPAVKPEPEETPPKEAPVVTTANSPAHVFSDPAINNTSCAQSIYAMLDKIDKKFLMAIALPHLRPKLMKDGMILTGPVARIMREPGYGPEQWRDRIDWLCDIGAILNQGGNLTVHPNVGSLIGQRA